ncbi:MAG TPA: group 1 truncated hemoglobin [Nakamurella sp.]
MSESAEGTYAALGRHPGIRRAVDQFYERIAADPALTGYFADADMDRLRWHVVELLAAAVGGPNRYTGRSMAQAHRGLHITDAAFDRVLGHLNATLVEVGAHDRTIREVLSTLSGMRLDIVED